MDKKELIKRLKDIEWEDFEVKEAKDLEKDLEKLNPNQRRIIREIIKNKNITQKELGQTVGISEKNVRNNIAKLKQIGIIRRIGPDKGGYWEILKKI